MKQWWVIFQKEQIELYRNYKWIWVPIVFALLGMMQPLTTYYLPQILEAAGGLPEGAVIELPTPTAPQILVETFGQFNTIGLLVLALAFMGIVSSERRSGVAALILVKPVSYFAYISAKWASALVLTVVSVLVGAALSWIYTVQLFGNIELSALLGAGTMLIWYMLIVSIVVFMSSLIKAQAAAAFISFIIAQVLAVVSSLFDSKLTWNPGLLSNYGGAMILEGTWKQGALPSILLACLLMVGFVWLGSVLFRSKELGL